jgi:Thioredoxin
MNPRLALGTLTLLAALFTSVVAQAAELLMFYDPGCVWCRRWNAEIAPSYPKTREGQQAPLRRVPIRNQARAGVALARPINVTPTFVLVEDGQEVGRIDGYAGKDFFYPMLAELLRRLAPPTQRLGPPLPRSASCAAAACRPPMTVHAHLCAARRVCMLAMRVTELDRHGVGLLGAGRTE